SYFLLSSLFPLSTISIYTLFLHDALPISIFRAIFKRLSLEGCLLPFTHELTVAEFNPRIFANFATLLISNFFINLFKKFEIKVLDRKSTRLHSSHVSISYAVFCLKKKIIF